MIESAKSVESAAACCVGLYELPLTRVLLGSSFHPGGLALTERLARSASVGPGDRILDLASGHGDTALHLARKYGAEVVGVELSGKQVAISNERAREAGLAHRVKFLQGDVNRLPFDSGVFDVVFCECALCIFSDPTVAATEARRVLKNRGLFALSDVVVNQTVPAELQSVLGQVLCISGALSQHAYEEVLKSGGFEKVRFRDASDTLQALIRQIEERLSKIAHWDEVGSATSLSLSEVEKTLRAARAFVSKGGLGYATFVARGATNTGSD